MAFNDNREFMEVIERTGDLVRVNKLVDWDGEAGAIIKLSDEKRGPAPLFERVKGYPPGYRILGSPLGTYRRISVAMGLPINSHIRSIQEEYEKRILSTIKPIIVTSGPCKDVIIKDENVDLCRLPATMNVEGEDARYMGTWDIIVTKDPDSDWTNWGMYRAIVHDRRTLGVTVTRTNDGGRIFLNKFQRFNKPMPIAVVVGADPLCHMAALIDLEVNENEVDRAGGLRRQPVELVKCETNDILVPAWSEIVVEGMVLPDSMVPGNPFGEYAGYMSPQIYWPACQVTAITHRRDPIFTVSHPGYPHYGGSSCSHLGSAVGNKRHFREHGLPVTDVNIPDECGGLLMIVGIRDPSAFTPTALALAAFSHDTTRQKVMIMEDDVDIFNLQEVFFHFATRCHPVRGIQVYNNIAGRRLTPNLSKTEKSQSLGSGVLFNCTWPVDWDREADVPPIASFEKRYTEELKRKVLKNWREYGFKS